MIVQGCLMIDPRRIARLGWIRIEGDRIAEMGEGDAPHPPDLGSPASVVCPGFIDAHLHLPQFDAAGCDAADLLTWLDEVVYPAELRWSDPAVVRAQAARACQALLRSGTLGFAGYLTSHAHAVGEALDAVQAVGLRAIVGQVLMDRNAPAPLTDQAPVPPLAPPTSRILTSVNPRFAVACGDRMLARAAGLATPSSIIQTHLAESVQECALVRDLFPGDAHYAGVYDRHGLLTDRTLLAHCLHLSEAEWRLIAARRSVVVHCPAANTFLRSGLFDLDTARRHGVRLALGSDVAAGPDLAMPRVARAMIEVAKCRAMSGAEEVAVPSPAVAWRMITRGNADALGWSDAGRLEVGAAADVLVLDPPFQLDRHLVGRLIHTWRDEYISHRIVGGRVVDPCIEAQSAGAPRIPGS